jgi:hypothetical protein
MTKNTEVNLKIKFESELFDRYGPLIGGKDLQKVLGYRNGDTYRQAVFRKTVPIKTFEIDNRRGRFALTTDIANWLTQQATKVRDE